MVKPHLTRRGLLAVAGTAACFALLRPRIAWAITVPINDFKTTMTTMFWVGEQSNAENDYIPNHESYWDKDWLASFGGIDHPGIATTIGRQASRLRRTRFTWPCPMASSARETG
jgi:hypothetical protein